MWEVNQQSLVARAPVNAASVLTPAFDRPSYRVTKRLLDILATLALAPVAIPVVAAAALLVRLDGSSAFYTQWRVGKDGELFAIWKLRTMRPDCGEVLAAYFRANPEAEMEWQLHQKIRHDPRVTTIGRFLRKYSIDELPQLLNVLLGQMSLVGPRPFMPEQSGQYPGSAYFSVQPGITGLWQVSERNSCTFAERADYDNRYAELMSLRTDFGIIWKTLSVVVRGTGC